MARLANAGRITIGTKFDQPLLGLIGPTNIPVGFDVEIGRIIAGQLGIPSNKIKWTETVTANREPFIQGNQVDLVVATYSINDKRKQVVSFAGPYYIAGQSLLVRANNKSITGPQDIAGKPVCSISGSNPAKKIQDLGAKVFLADNINTCLEPLRAGRVDAVSTDNVILGGIVAQNPGEFKTVGEPFSREPYGVGLPHDDIRFRQWINDVLEKAAADGSYERAWKTTVRDVLPYTPAPPVDRY
ncbi:glutamate ABC transporter substrate-binding protein [Nocardia sp. 2YAB30]|uniref:glutamate ABC transporter substrate-binding protein n=1 Tax=unclassified Nocardia TaxID=2637762 RepID=UPI003F958453